jgi:hypothetical protein
MSLRFVSMGLFACALMAACGDDSNTSTSSGNGGSADGGGAAAGGNGSGGTAGAGTGGDAVGGNATGGNATGGDATGGDASGGDASGGNGNGGDGGNGGVACTWGGNTCGVGMYCNAPGCGQGTCAPITSVDNTAKTPVCGCDGVNYWNDVTASNHGMSVASSGACPQPTFCGGFANIQCPSQAHFCGYDVMNANGCFISDVGGSCWGMPLTCNILGFGGQQRSCGPNGQCLYECQAIKTGQSYWGPDNTCPQ